MKTTHLFLISLLLICCLIIPVFAYDYECNDEVTVDKYFTSSESGASSANYFFNELCFEDVGARQGFKGLTIKAPSSHFTVDVGAPYSAYTTAIIKSYNETITYGTAILGYNYLVDELKYIWYLNPTSCSIFKGLDGLSSFYIEYNRSSVYNFSMKTYSQFATSNCPNMVSVPDSKKVDFAHKRTVAENWARLNPSTGSSYTRSSYDCYDIETGFNVAPETPTVEWNKFSIFRDGWDSTFKFYYDTETFHNSRDIVDEPDVLISSDENVIAYDIILYGTSKMCQDVIIINESAPPPEEFDEELEITVEDGTTFNTGEYVSFSFDTNIPSYDWVTWGFTNAEGYYLDKHLISFMKDEVDDWYQYNEDTYTYDIPVSAPYPYRITQSWNKSSESYHEQYGSDYEHEVYVRVSNQELGYQASDTIEVTVLDSPDFVTIPIYVYSDATGGLLNNWNARIWEFQPSNTTSYIYNKNSPYNYMFKYMGYYQIEINKTGYSNKTTNYIITPDLNKIQIYLGKTCGAPAGQGCINFYVMRSDDWNIKLSGVSITLNNQTKQTNSAGYVQFFVPVDTELDYNAIKEPDYFSSSGSIEVDDEYETLQELVYLTPKSIMPTTAPLPTITTVPTTLTPEQREGMGIVQFIIYYLSNAFGTNQSETGLILGAIIVFLFLICGGMVAGGMGAIGGMTAGFVISLALKILPIWTFFAIIGLAFLGLIFFRNKDG